MTEHLKRCAAIIKRVLKEEVPSLKIDNVNVKEAFDRDGDRYLDAYLTYSGLLVQETYSPALLAVTKIRPKLAEIGETGFPVLNFSAQKEAVA